MSVSAFSGKNLPQSATSSVFFSSITSSTATSSSSSSSSSSYAPRSQSISHSSSSSSLPEEKNANKPAVIYQDTTGLAITQQDLDNSDRLRIQAADDERDKIVYETPASSVIITKSSDNKIVIPKLTFSGKEGVNERPDKKGKARVKSYGSAQKNSHTKFARERLQQFSSDSLYLRGIGIDGSTVGVGELWCRVCNVEVNLTKKDLVRQHIEGAKHLKLMNDDLRKQLGGKMREQEQPCVDRYNASEKEAETYRKQVTRVFLENNFPLRTLDKENVREMVSKPGKKVHQHSEMMRYVPIIVKEENEKTQKWADDAEELSAAFDETEREDNILCIVLRRVDAFTRSIQKRLLYLMHFDRKASSVSICGSLNSRLVQWSHKIIGFLGDNASVNSAGMNALLVTLNAFPVANFFPCWPHLFNRTGGYFNFPDLFAYQSSFNRIADSFVGGKRFMDLFDESAIESQNTRWYCIL